MLTIFFRAMILYAVSVIAVRMMGKRQIGQLQPYELVAAMLIADLAAGPMSGAETPLLFGVVPIAALVLLHSAAGMLGMKSPGFRRLLNGSSRVLVQDGNIQYDELKRVCLPVSDLLEMVRESGIMSIGDVATAVLETNGTLSVFPRAEARPVTLKDMQLQAEEETIPVVLISDGKYREKEIAQAGLTREQLDQFLKKHGTGDARVLLCSLDGQGQVFLQLCCEGDIARRVPLKEGKK